MSDSKKRPHDQAAHLDEENLAAEEPLAKKPKLFEEAQVATELPNSQPNSDPSVRLMRPDSSHFRSHRSFLSNSLDLEAKAISHGSNLQNAQFES
jgi:hypothetical protein